jgi:hypothetical protein
VAIYADNRGRAAEAEPISLLTEGAAGVAVIILAILALAGVSATPLASIAAIVMGVGLIVQAFNSPSEQMRVLAANKAVSPPDTAIDGEFMVGCLCGQVGIGFGVLALVRIEAATLLPAALTMFGSSLLLSGVIGMRAKAKIISGATEAHTVSHQGLAVASGAEVLIGLAAIILGVLSLILVPSSVLVLVGFLAVGAVLLLVSATIGGAAIAC